jgi:hypothetical protein
LFVSDWPLDVPVSFAWLGSARPMSLFRSDRDPLRCCRVHYAGKSDREPTRARTDHAAEPVDRGTCPGVRRREDASSRRLHPRELRPAKPPPVTQSTADKYKRDAI